MALFMVANNLQTADVLDESRDLAFPASVIDLVIGNMGQPPGGFPKRVRDRILRDRKSVRGRPGASMPPADFREAAVTVEGFLHRKPSDRDVVSFLLYPKVFREFAHHQQKYSDTSDLPTPVFFYGIEPGEEVAVDIEPGKTLIIKFLTIGDPHPDGRRTVFFELNGQPRDLTVEDHSLEATTPKRAKADANNPDHVGAAMPGMVVGVGVQPGDLVKKSQKLLTLEAMKMETTIYAERDAKIGSVLVQPGSQVETGDLLIELE
jgi:pyruvate carboxylase